MEMYVRVTSCSYRWLLPILAVLLQACGGGGGESPGTGGTGTTVLSGQVIYDAPMAKASVSVRDAEGRSWSAETDASGNYSITLPAATPITPPLLVRAQGVGRHWEVGNGATLANTADMVAPGVLSPAMVPVKIDPAKGLETPVLLYAVSNTPGQVHVTPATTLVVNRLMSQRAEAAFANLGKVGTSIAAGLSPTLVSGAQTAVKQLLAQAGLPAALIDDPAAASLVPVDLTSTYQKLVSGDILSAVGSLLNAIVDNQINFGCAGEGYGLMADDGQPRPSCLAGANVPESWLLTSFIARESPRSLDIETRADELAGVQAAGGGWKFQSERLPPLERRARVREKLLAALRGMQTSIDFNGPAALVLESLRNWADGSWDNLNTKICSSITMADLSDLTYSYQELKLGMKPVVVTPTEDAAQFLNMSGNGIKSTAVNRVVPQSFEDGSHTNTCAIVEKNARRLRELVAAYQPAMSRPALATLLAEFDATLGVWQTYSLADRLDEAVLLPMISIQVDMVVQYQAPPFDWNSSTSAFSRLIESTRLCVRYGDKSQQCRANMYTPEQLRAEVASWAATVPPGQAAGSAEQAATTLVKLGDDMAQFYMDEYEQHFDQYFHALAFFTVAEAQGYVAYSWQRDNPERDALVAVPDVKQVGYKVNGSSLELTGQFLIHRKDVHLPRFVSDKPVMDSLRLVPVNVRLDQLPALVMCNSDDLACMGRLRRTRSFTQAELSLELSGSVPLWFATTSYWQVYLNSMLAHDEVLRFESGHTEWQLTLKDE